MVKLLFTWYFLGLVGSTIEFVRHFRKQPIIRVTLADVAAFILLSFFGLLILIVALEGYKDVTIFKWDRSSKMR